MRVGTGYDVHRLVEGRLLIIGGVKIPFSKGLLGHSDADVLLHAICDALLGAAALGDIGLHFPDHDDRYKDISSLLLLSRVGEMIYRRDYRIANIDSTVVAQHPRLAPYMQQMRENIAQSLNITLEQVNVKATTTEGLGFEGNGEGISAQAVVLLEHIDQAKEEWAAWELATISGKNNELRVPGSPAAIKSRGEER